MPSFSEDPIYNFVSYEFERGPFFTYRNKSSFIHDNYSASDAFLVDCILSLTVSKYLPYLFMSCYWLSFSIFLTSETALTDIHFLIINSLTLDNVDLLSLMCIKFVPSIRKSRWKQFR